jgi:hypothetical protein
MDCSGVKEHLVDFLYEELPREARVAFTEHVRGCSVCKAEVASYRQTLGNARAALSGPLATEPPARVHDAIMRAATAAATKMAERAPTSREDRRADASEPGFFAKLLRTPWLFPAFGAVSVATVVFLVRVLKNPEVIPGQRATSIEEQAVPAEMPATAPTKEIPAGAKPAGEPEPPLPAPAEKTATRAGKVGGAKAGAPLTPNAPVTPKRKALHDDPLAGLGFGDGVREDVARKSAAPPILPNEEKKHRGRDEASPGGSGAGLARRFAEPPPPRQAASGSVTTGELQPRAKKGLAGPAEAAKDEGRPRSQAKASRGMDDLLGDFARPKSAPPPTEQTAVPQRVAETAKADTTEPESAPPAAAPSPVAAAPLPASHAASNQAAESERRARSFAPPPAPSAAPASPPKPSAQARRAPAEGADKTAEGTPRAEDADAKMAKGESGPSIEDSIHKADRLFASHNWSAAAEAYRDLLRRYPAHREAPKWRARVDQALVAERETRDSTKMLNKAKKASGEALDGLKQ